MSYGGKMYDFSRSDVIQKIWTFLVFGGIFLSAAGVGDTNFNCAEVIKCEIIDISIEDIVKSAKTFAGKGVRTPPTPSTILTISTMSQPRTPGLVPTSMNTCTGIQSNSLETSNVLSKANEVLYMNPNQMYSLQLPPVQNTSLQQFSEPQYKQQVTNTDSRTTTTQTTMPRSTCINRSNAVVNSATNTVLGQREAINIYPNSPENATPPWLSQLFHNLDSRLVHIDNQLSNQNSRWQNMDHVLQSQSAMLQNQNTRMTNIEQQVTEINDLKGSVNKLDAKLHILDTNLMQTNCTMNEYQNCIDTYSDLCDEIRREKVSSDSVIDDLVKRVERLEYEKCSIESNQKEKENNIIDLQCRSMRENLIFTGISESQLDGHDQYEDVERTLLRFLEQEMGVYRIIDFHRVHRIGAFDKDTADTYPRPIIASFEKFKDREFIRSLARETLRGRRYGIREQFPRVIEQKRKMVYPVAKEARQNKENKVRLVRDRLFINNKEVNVETDGASEWQRPRNAKKPPRTHWQNPTDDKSSRRGDRVFYRGRGTKTQHSQRTSYAKKLVDFNIPLSNPFSPLAGYNDESRQSSKSISRKHPATSPLDDAHILKKHREDSNSDTNSEMMIDQTETRMSQRKFSSENSANDASYSS